MYKDSCPFISIRRSNMEADQLYIYTQLAQTHTHHQLQAPYTNDEHICYIDHTIKSFTSLKTIQEYEEEKKKKKRRGRSKK